MKRELRRTADGSHTIYVEELDETYHSAHGAIQEALHVFIRNGLESLQQKPSSGIRVLEMGLGTGLNAWLTALHAKHPIEYTGIEAFPLEATLLDSLNYTVDYSREDQLCFQRISNAKWEMFEEIRPEFQLKKLCISIENAELPLEYFDLVYYDAFGPRAQKELWELEPLSKVVHAMKKGGVFSTYCAQGQFKRNLKALGLEVESLPGPPGKREMTRAVRN